MEKVLVTQLQGRVQNDNLPVYDTIFLNYTQQSNQQQFVVGASDDNVIVTFANAVHLGSASGQQIAGNTPVTVNSGTRMSFFTVSGQTSMEKFVKIQNIYNIESIIGAGMGFSMEQSIKSGLPSLLYLTGLVQFGGAMNENSIFNCKKIRLNTENAETEFSLGGNTLQYVISNGWVTKAPNSVRKIYGRWKGDVVDFPVQLRYYKGQSGQTTGELQDYVAKARAAGRTTGYLVLMWINNGQYCVNITLNGTSLKNNPSVTPVTIDDAPCAIVQWDGTSVSFGTAEPSDFSVYRSIDSDYGWQPYV